MTLREAKLHYAANIKPAPLCGASRGKTTRLRDAVTCQEMSGVHDTASDSGEAMTMIRGVV